MEPIEGEGELAADGRTLGQIRYEVFVWEEGDAKEWRGWIEADGPTVLYPAFMSDAVTLQLAGGTWIPVVITQIWTAKNLAEIRISGSIPRISFGQRERE
jgi:hypothetical protein